MTYNIAKDFVDYMIANGYGSAFGTDVFIGAAPTTPDDCWWVIISGGNSIQRNQTGERLKKYLLEVYYRNTDAEELYNLMQAFEEFVNTSNCTQLANFDTIEMEATAFPADQDLDADDRTVGLVQIAVTTYY